MRKALPLIVLLLSLSTTTFAIEGSLVGATHADLENRDATRSVQNQDADLSEPDPEILIIDKDHEYDSWDEVDMTESSDVVDDMAMETSYGFDQ